MANENEKRKPTDENKIPHKGTPNVGTPNAGTTSPPHEPDKLEDWKRAKRGVIDARDADKFKVS